MSRNPGSQRQWRQAQKGTTLLLALAAIVVAMVMAALAIDISTLYLAHSEAQRAADAAALAAAKAFVASGVTTDINDSTAQSVAVTLGQQHAIAALQQNLISGQPGQLVGPISSNPVFDFTVPGNPKVTVIVQQTGLPTFFSRIWNRIPSTVSATAVAEAYNPSGTSAAPPVSAQCVKPFIVPNLDPGQPNGVTFDSFIDQTTGMVSHPQRVAPWGSPPGVVGETIHFVADCPGLSAPGSCHGHHNNGPKASQSGTVLNLEFVAAVLPASGANGSCPSCGASLSTQFESDISCCNTAAMACSTGAGNPVLADMAIDPSRGTNPLSSGLQCVSHATASGAAQGQDSLDPLSFPSVAGAPFRFVAGSNNPLTKAPSPTVAVGDVVSTSDSIITMLIYDGTPIVPAGTVSILGYMQVFLTQENGDGTFDGVVLNISGCGNTNGTGAAISGGGVSPIPVRLIHN